MRSALESAGFEVVAEVGDADGALDAVQEHLPDVALLDIHMPGNGISAALKIGERFPDVAVVMLTVSGSDDDLFAALRAGVSGYLLKDTDPDRLAHALNGVLRGEAAIPRRLVSRLMDQFRSQRTRRIPIPRRRGVELTAREAEVLDLMRRGMTTAQMAERLFVSNVTIRSHVAAILKKLHVPDRESAVRLLEEE